MLNTKNRARIGGGRIGGGIGRIGIVRPGRIGIGRPDRIGWGNPSILAEPTRIGLATNSNLYAYNYVTDYNKCYRMCKKVKNCNTDKCRKNCRKECR